MSVQVNVLKPSDNDWPITVPPKPEARNDHWRRDRQRVKGNDPDNAWPCTRIP